MNKEYNELKKLILSKAKEPEDEIRKNLVNAQSAIEKERAAEQLANNNLRMAIHYTERTYYKKRVLGISKEEYFATIVNALLNACRHYDPTRDISLYTFAIYYFRKEINKLTMNQKKMINNKEVLEAIDKLTPNEKNVICGRFLDENKKTLDELALEMQISREGVRRIENKAIHKLQDYIKENANG